MNDDAQQPSQHRMGRRSPMNDYSLPGMYHITIRVADDMGHPFGQVVGDASQPDDSPSAPQELTPVGRMVAHELLNSIRSHYAMIEIQDYVIMPEHLHFIVEVHEPLVSRSGRKVHLGQVVAGFKKGCNRRYWALTGQAATAYIDKRHPTATAARRGEPAEANGAATRRGKPAEAGGAAIGASSLPAVRPQGAQRPPSGGATDRPPLFAPGYVDVMPLKSGQLAQQRRYIKDNPRSRLLRSTHRQLLQARRGGIDTALSVAALIGYLKRECHPSQIGEERLAQIRGRLLTRADGRAAKSAGGAVKSDDGAAKSDDGRGKPVLANSAERQGADDAAGTSAATRAMIDCDSYGDRELLTRRLLPVVTHRRDKWRFALQKARCIEAAKAGAVLVSARIAEGERDIIDTAATLGLPVVLVIDNGMPELYHPSAERIQRCLSHQLLLVTPWQYHYRRAGEDITVTECKAMNCIVQALCRLRDDWWTTDTKEGATSPK